MRLLTLYSLSAVVLWAGVIEYDELITKQNSLSKDYYINRLANERKLSIEQAQNLQNQIFRKAGVVSKSLNKIAPPKPSTGKCQGVNASNITTSSIECQNALTTISYSLKLSSQVRAKIAENLEVLHPQKARILKILNESNPAQIFAKNMQTEQFLAYFRAINTQKQAKQFSIDFDEAFLNKLYQTKSFNAILTELVLERKLDNFRENFIKISPNITEKNGAFFLALNAVTLNKDEKATQFFARAEQTYEAQSQRDNALFWLYLIKKDKNLLIKLANSTDINIYSLFAKDYVKSDPFDVYVPRPKKLKFEGSANINDPFFWEKMNNLVKNMSANEAREFAKQFYANDSIGYYAFFMQKANGWNRHYYVMPQSPELENIQDNRKALIYALARQESRFIPGVVSTSYALGTMQFMPFLANAIGKKELKIANFDQDDMFKADVAYKFANHHLDYLEKFLYHPLFIAYAYNGGIGFTKRLITRDDMFRDGKFEPFLSMELVPVEETRLYGKKVLANYIVYNSLMGSNIKISTLLQTLTQPALTDKFRK
ncbi:lytic transglycosylase domain-containing protein [Campylobacter mucosalis]|uniref:lytic transglycosylase domain-containing protein n=1 Tax=Campylobacter mucosalis TaxID=202 RepID=UPI00147082F8|nr:lytic transglycosylase domain-containing protein [Campylobacter mucosalis]